MMSAGARHHGHRVEVVAAVHHRRRAGGVPLHRDRRERNWRHGLKRKNVIHSLTKSG